MNRQDAEDAKTVTKKYPCTLKQFLLLGQLGFVEIGASLDDIFKLLGEPSLTTKYSRRYWSLEIIVQPSYKSLTWFRLNCSEESGIILPPPLQAYGYFPDKNTDLSEIESYLKQEAIEYHVFEYNGGYFKGIHLSSNISINFDGYEDSAKLTGIACIS